MSYPKIINPCPILDALIEIRFSSKINSNAVFGLIYNALQSDFPKVESLPILQLPDIVRANDPNFRYKPHYKISNDKFVLQIGPDVIAISAYPSYVGWEVFSSKIFNILDIINEVSIINIIERIGLRYINFFKGNIVNDINLSVTINDKAIVFKNTVLRTEIEHSNGYSSTIQIANNAINNGQIGSIIDIDTFCTYNLLDFFPNKKEIINNAHTNEKELFFSLLKTDFLQTLNPTF